MLELMYLEGLSGAQVGETLGIPEGTVRGRIRRGLARLRERVTVGLADGVRGESVSLEDLERWAAEVRGHIAASDAP